MNLSGRRIHIAGSAAPSADEGKLRYANQIIADLTLTLLQKGAAFVISFGKEPRLRHEADLPPIIFDWTVAEVVATALDAGSATPATACGRVIATVSTTKTDSHIPAERRTIYENLRSKNAIDIRFLRAGWSSGALQRQKLAEIGDVLIVLSGGQGVEQLAVEYSSRGKPVIPMDLQLGSSSCDGSGGGAHLFDRALEDPGAFFRVDEKSSAADLLEKTRTRDGSTEVKIVVSALQDLLDELASPRAFYVRLLNKDLPEYPSVEAFFRTTVDKLVAELGYERCEMGIGENEFAWMNEAIFQSLHHSNVVVVDITGVRPNCFVELGYALGNHQKIIFTAREDTSFPFDVFAIEGFLWKDGEDPNTRLDRFRKHWRRNINMPRLVRPNEAR
jgi:hypothetical protein